MHALLHLLVAPPASSAISKMGLVAASDVSKHAHQVLAPVALVEGVFEVVPFTIGYFKAFLRKTVAHLLLETQKDPPPAL